MNTPVRKALVLNTVLALSVVLMAAQCVPATPPAEATKEEAAPTEAPKEEAAPAEAPDTLVVLAATTPPGFDPDIWGGKSWEKVLVNVYDSILDYEMVSEEKVGIPQGTGVAGVAQVNGLGDEGIVGNFFESWEISEDKQTITFHVRQGHKSYWGNQATADDWIWRVERAFAVKDVGEFQLRVIGITGPEDVKKIDDMTVEMHTPAGPNPVFFKGLCVPVLFGVDVDVMREEGWLTEDDPWGLDAMKQHDFGFGAYHSVEFVPGSHVKFVANPYYWKGEPLFKEVLLREVPESSNRLAIMISGEAHLCDELTLVQKAELIGGKGEAQYVGLPEASFHYWAYLNRSRGAFMKKECFQAVGYAIPYEEVQRVPYFGFGKIMREAVVPMYGETVNVGNSPYYYDVDKAAELWEAGNCPSSWTLTFDIEHPEWEDVGILIRTEFAKFGVDVILDKQPEHIISSKSSNRELEAFFEESAAFVADAGYAAWLNWHKDSFANLQAWYDEDNEQISAQIDQAMAMLPGPERTELLHDIQDVLLDRGGIMPILVPGWHVSANKHLRGIKWYSTQDIHWFDLYWE